MSADADAQAPALEAMISLTERLTSLVADQARAFEQHRPQDAAAAMPQVSALALAYRDGSARLRAGDAALAGAQPPLRQRLLAASEALEAVLDRQGRALGACRSVTEGLVKAIAAEIAARRGEGAGYGPRAGPRPAVTAITLNRRA
ncbi:MAG TPA: flagellar basal body protein [Caulobacteraceae bacterium]|nr:flagellar basal body protein [Caulobacteraceae bacterium]